MFGGKMVGGIEVRVWYDYAWAHWNIIIEEDFGPKGMHAWVMRDGDVLKLPVLEGTIPPVFLTLPRDVGEALFIAWAKEMSEKGIRTDNDHKIQGILEAQKYHLEDLRVLLKLRGKK